MHHRKHSWLRGSRFTVLSFSLSLWWVRSINSSVWQTSGSCLTKWTIWENMWDPEYSSWCCPVGQVFPVATCWTNFANRGKNINMTNTLSGLQSWQFPLGKDPHQVYCSRMKCGHSEHSPLLTRTHRRSSKVCVLVSQWSAITEKLVVQLETQTCKATTLLNERFPEC